MKNILTLILLLCAPFVVLAQDIIVLNNGDLVQSDVIEVGIVEIKYKRFDQKNGPVYTIARGEIFAIHYHDGSKDFLTPTDRTVANVNKSLDVVFNDTTEIKDIEMAFMKKRVPIRVSVGLLKIYSAVNEIGVDNYEAKTANWGLDVGMGLNTNLVVGFAFSKGSYAAHRVFIDDGAFTRTTIDISQETTSVTFWGRYYVRTKHKQLRPYGTLGLALNSSHVNVSTITEITDQTIDFVRGGRIMDVFPLVRVGAELMVWDNLGFFAEVGYGVTLVNVGLMIQL